MSDIGTREKFKRINRIMESRNGQDISHPVMNSGIHAGTSAMGEYGLMPKTAQDLVKHSSDPLDQIIKNADPSQVEEILKGNPHAYERLVDKQTDKIVNKTEDPIAAAVMWNNGPNLSKDRVEKIIKNNPGNFTDRAADAIDETHPTSDMQPSVYDYIQSLKDYDDFKKKKQDRLYNPVDLEDNDVNLKIPRK